MSRKIIITSAITGAIHTPTMSKHLPYTPEDIAQHSIEAAEAGAAIIHLHARNPENGSPTGDPEMFRRFLPKIHNETDAVINITTGGSPAMSPEERLAATLEFEPEMCSFNMGSINFSFHPIADRIKNWDFDWEEDYVANSDSNIFRNTFADMEKTIRLTKDLNIRFEHECYDVGHLYNLSFLYKKGLLPECLFVQGVFGILGGIGASVNNLVFMKNTAEQLFGSALRWSTLGAGKDQMSLVTQSALMGGHIRVGLEDSLFIGRGQLAESSAEQVKKIRRIVEELGFEIATPDEAREILQLKGKDKVNIK